MEHYILCASIFMCIALHFCVTDSFVHGDPISLVQFYAPGVNQGARGMLPINLVQFYAPGVNQGARGMLPTSSVSVLLA